MQFFHSSSPFAGAMNTRTTRESYATVERVLFEEFSLEFSFASLPKENVFFDVLEKKEQHY
jgi:hypothetical protein